MRTSLNRIERVTGIFVVFALLLLVAALVVGGGRAGMAGLVAKNFVLYVVAPEGYGAQAGSPIHLYDVKIGAVSKVEIVRDPAYPKHPVRMTIEIDPAMASMLHEDAKVAIEAGMPPFTVAVLKLDSHAGRPLPTNATLVAEVRASLVTALMSNADIISRDVHKILVQSEIALTNIAQITKTLNDGQSMASRVLTDPKLGADMATAFEDARSATADAKRMIASVSTAAEQAPAAVDDVRALTSDAREATASVRQGIDDARRVVTSVERTLRLVEQMAVSLRTTASYAPELARKADTSLEESKRLVEAAQRNIFIRGSLEPREAPRTQARVRPPAVLPRARRGDAKGKERDSGEDDSHK